jgi:heme A synthase
LLVISFFAKIERGVRWAVIVLVTTFVQIALGVLSHFTAVIGALHGAVAMALFGVAMMAAMRVGRAAPVEEAVPASVV